MAFSSEGDHVYNTTSIKRYHVFINHRGPDVKNSLASNIYYFLREKGLDVFFDKREFKPGQELLRTIKEAISSSSVQIAIFSPRYAESPWCLNELCLMQKSGATLIPVFYQVQPGDLRRLQNGDGIYADAFEEHEKKVDGRGERRYDSCTIAEWREALHKMSTISGLELRSTIYNGDEGMLVSDICGQVMEQISAEGNHVYNEVQTSFCALNKPYHVFINHRGPDAKNSLASTIYYLLREKEGLDVFFDKREFKNGEELPLINKEAICNSSLHIAILSPTYAESPWCLDELCLMLESCAKIIPVFYHVEPADLRRLQKGEGRYADAFKDYEKKVDARGEGRYDFSRTREWRKALQKICNISGLELGSAIYNGDEGMLLNAICRQVMEHVKIERKKSIDGLIGLDKAVDEFKDFMLLHGEHSEKVKILGIVGTPGSGKTSFAEEFFYRHRNSFNRSSLLLEVRNASKRNGLPGLQRQLLKDLVRDPSVAINNVTEGKYMIADRVGRLCRSESLKFLIVIDDVDRLDQLDAFLFIKGVLSPESLIIVTSRNKAVLKLSGIRLQYEIKPLGEDDARELLCGSAFHEAERFAGFEDLIQTALTKYGGLPKLLKIIGGNLRLYGNNDKEQWEDELQMISEIPDIFKTIYDDLEEEEKQVFLDIACFFEGMEKNTAIRIWAGSGWRGARTLKKLENMCLVHINDKNCLTMQVYLRDLGREIAVRQLHNSPDLPCRLWRPNDATSFLPKQMLLQEQTKIRGSQKRYRRKTQKASKSSSSLNIELLDVSGDFAYATFSHRLRNLAWLRWENCPSAKIALTEMKNLRVLELANGSLETLWDPASQLPEELREISVIECTRLVQIPPTIALLKHLEKMTLDCTTGLQSLPPEFCQLQSLKHLVLKRCECLRLLPPEFCQLQSLEHLVLKQCVCLSLLPDGFGQLTNLQHIDFSYCQELRVLPPSFGQLIKLKTLDIGNCWNLTIEADIFGEIMTIEELNFENCTKLRELPTQTTLQGSLRKLNLLGTNLEVLPDNMHKLINLQHLYIGSPLLQRIPSSLAELPCLMEIHLLNCELLISYPEFIGPLSLSDASQMQTEEAAESRTSYVYLP